MKRRGVLWLVAAIVTAPLSGSAAATLVGPLDTGAPTHVLDVDPGSGVAHYVLHAPMPLETLELEAYGVSCQPVTVHAQVDQGGSFSQTFDLAHAGRLVATLAGPAIADLDLAVYGPSGHLIALSERPGSSAERIEIRVPADGRWRIEVRGREVPALWAEFTLEVNAIEGRDLEVISPPSGPFAPGEAIPVELRLDRAAFGCAATQAILVWGPVGDPALDEPLTVRPAGAPAADAGHAP